MAVLLTISPQLGTTGADLLLGTVLADSIRGNDGNDTLLGGLSLTDPGDGSDTLRGEAGNDRLVGAHFAIGVEDALFLRGEEIVQAQPLAVAVGSTVGAGDALVAGLVAALIVDASLEGIARLATAFAAAKLGCQGANLPSRERVLALASEVQIKRLDQASERQRSDAGLPSPLGRGAGGEGTPHDQIADRSKQPGAQP